MSSNELVSWAEIQFIVSQTLKGRLFPSILSEFSLGAVRNYKPDFSLVWMRSTRVGKRNNASWHPGWDLVHVIMDLCNHPYCDRCAKTEPMREKKQPDSISFLISSLIFVANTLVWKPTTASQPVLREYNTLSFWKQFAVSSFWQCLGPVLCDVLSAHTWKLLMASR